METTFIYALKDPRDGSVRYVGKSNDPVKRYAIHLCRQTGVDTQVKRWVQDLKAQGLRPILVIVEEVPRAMWEDKERYWIAHYRNANTELTNVTSGGMGFRDIPEEIELDRRRKVSAARMGMVFSEEHKKHLADAKRKQFATTNSREILSRHWAKLSDSEVLEVLDMAKHRVFSQRVIGKLYGVTGSTVSEILTGKRYQHALPPRGTDG